MFSMVENPENLVNLEAQQAFAEKHGWGGADLFPLASDASNRSYIRLVDGARRCMLMVAPPATEKLPEYLYIANHLKGLGLRVPEVFAADTTAGLALIEDFGDKTFTRLLANGADEEALYLQAAEVLSHLHHTVTRGRAANAPPYDMDLMLEEVSRFLLWFVPAARGNGPTSAETRAFQAAWQAVLAGVSQDQTAFVFRDFHVDNLMIVEEKHPPATPREKLTQTCGLLDFQDALTGPPAYDMVSLLEDARCDIKSGTIVTVLKHYFKNCPEIDQKNFKRDMVILGAQRHTKIAGLFVRLSVQDHKHIYLDHLPRVLRLLGTALASPLMAEVRTVMETIVPGFLTADATTSLVQSLRRHK
jgi:N-acetylmuramate 1-kinase